MRARHGHGSGPPRSRGGDAASASTIGFVIALSVFMISTGVLAAFAMQPASLARPSDAILRARAEDVLDVLVRSPGSPTGWGDSATTIDAMARPGLLQGGTVRTIDEDKFYALSRGDYSTTGTAGKVDYDELRERLGISEEPDNYQLRLRTYPVFGQEDYGLRGMEDYRIAYIGDYSGSTEQGSSKFESGTLDDLPVAFTNVTRTAFVDGDKYRDAGADLRDYLAPRLNLQLDDIEEISGTNPITFDRFDATELAAAGFPAPPQGSYAIALGSGGAFTYDKSKDFRVTIGYADFTTMLWPPMASWYEMVEGEGENSTLLDTYHDYGVIEARVGTTWYAINPASSTPATGRHPSVHSESGGAPGTVDPDSWVRHTVDFGLCVACIGATEVEIALRWRADSDSNRGVGWFVDDFRIADSSGTVGFREGFEHAYYRALVVGSNVDQNSMTAAEVKYSIRDFVFSGGSLVVLGGSNNVNWLQPIFGAGIDSTGGDAATVPDVNHAFLTAPNSLNYRSYTNGNAAWEVNDPDFTTIVQGDTADDEIISISDEGAFGDTGGYVILTSYYPYLMSKAESSRFTANSLVYGRYAALFLDVGPPIPSGVAVARATATAIMDRTRDDSGELIEMQFVLYLWR